MRLFVALTAALAVPAPLAAATAVTLHPLELSAFPAPANPAIPAVASVLAALDAPEIASAAGPVRVVPVPALALGLARQGLPQRAPEPRTLHEFWPVFAGFVATWIGIIAYLLSFNARLRRLADLMDGDGAGGTER